MLRIGAYAGDDVRAEASLRVRDDRAGQAGSAHVEEFSLYIGRADIERGENFRLF